jgi:hypothetical protein
VGLALFGGFVCELFAGEDLLCPFAWHGCFMFVVLSNIQGIDDKVPGRGWRRMEDGGWSGDWVRLDEGRGTRDGCMVPWQLDDGNSAFSSWGNGQ